MIRAGMKPGKELGRCLEKCLEAVLEEPELNTKERLLALALGEGGETGENRPDRPGVEEE